MSLPTVRRWTCHQRRFSVVQQSGTAPGNPLSWRWVDASDETQRMLPFNPAQVTSKHKHRCCPFYHCNFAEILFASMCLGKLHDAIFCKWASPGLNKQSWCWKKFSLINILTWHSQGRINHWANRANARGLTLLGASRLNIKTLLYCFFKFLGCSPRVEIVELFDYCV